MVSMRLEESWLADHLWFPCLSQNIHSHCACTHVLIWVIPIHYGLWYQTDRNSHKFWSFHRGFLIKVGEIECDEAGFFGGEGTIDHYFTIVMSMAFVLVFPGYVMKLPPVVKKQMCGTFVFVFLGWYTEICDSCSFGHISEFIGFFIVLVLFGIPSLWPSINWLNPSLHAPLQRWSLL